MSEVPADIQKLLERVSERISELEASGETAECSRLRRVAALLQQGDFPLLTKEECDLLAEWRGANRKLARLTEHRRLILDKWLSACRLRLSSGPRQITDEQYEQWRAWLAANWAEPKTSAPADLPSVEEDSPVPAAPPSDSAEGHQAVGDGQSDVIVAVDDGCQSNIPDRISAPQEMLEPAIAEMLPRIPEAWQAYRPNGLTEVQAQALFLLTAAGMVQRRERFRLKMAGQSLVVEATLDATGEYGLVEAMERLAAQLWADWQDAFTRWDAGNARDDSPFYFERLDPSEWRLTDQGVLARSDLAAGQSRPVLDFVLGLGFFDGQPRLLPDGRVVGRESVGGSGSLVRMQKIEGGTVTAATANVPSQGAGEEGLARMLAKMFEAMQAVGSGGSGPAAQSSDQSPEKAQRGDKSRREAAVDKIRAAQEQLEEGKEDWDALLPSRARRAYGQYLRSLPHVNDSPTDRDCYDWAKDHNEGSALPAFDTWQRYVRTGRQHHGDQKNNPRGGRRGRSIDRKPHQPRPREHGYTQVRDEKWHGGTGPGPD